MTLADYKRPIVVAVLMLSALVLSTVATPQEKLADTRQHFVLDQAVPRQFDDWRVDDSVAPLPPSPDQASVLNQIYDQILSRTYINSRGERVMLSITYGSRQTQQLRAHRQEVCYSAQGFRITELQHVQMTVGGGTLPATRMVATQGRRVEPVTYWFTTGDTVVLSYWDREFAQFRYALSGFVPDGYLVRLSSLSTSSSTAFGQHVAFANALMSHLDPELRRRLVGHS
ncbi:exosortase-associated protein EpsI, B-type [Ideonella sp. BN130291]|uniref:exosortase-associated protein EpsI, B-type n=1 Tax=Ideonella sp. BN130291 TaxID=3112940 RepID=UPI002E253F86|nr:EpsI family protein [Ideonella sp. BN130291]